MAIQDYINQRREQGKITPVANYVDTRRAAGGATPVGNLLGYKSPTGDTGAVTPSQACTNDGGQWIIDPMAPGGGRCKMPTPDPITKGADIGSPGSTVLPPQVTVPPSLNPKDLQVGADQTPIPWMQTGAYADILANMANSPAFGGQTLQELEDARIQAMKADIGETYGTAADELTQRLNQEAAAKGMFSSGARVQNIQKGVGDLLRQQGIKEAQGAAEIRGERPQLLLQERQQRAEIANMWGQMDLTTQGHNLDSMLQNKLMEYDRQFKNSGLTVQAFQGNMNLLGMFLDYEINSARTDADRQLITARIDEIYASLDDVDKQRLLDMIGNFAMGALGRGGLGG